MRDRSSSSAAIVVMVIAVSLFTFLVFLQGFSSYVVASIENRIAISTYFTDEASEQDILDAKEAIIKMSVVRQVEYVSKAEALERFQERHLQDDVVMESLVAVGGNPLLASLSIRAESPEAYEQITAFLSTSSFAPLISKVDYQDRAPVIQRVSQVSAAVRVGVFLMSFILGIIAVLVAFNTVRLAIFNSRDEIEVMKLVGASNWFVRGPFLVQGILAGASATGITLLLMIPSIFFFAPRLEALVPGFSLWSYLWGNFFMLLLLQLGVGVGLGVLSSTIAIRRYLRV